MSGILAIKATRGHDANVQTAKIIEKQNTLTVDFEGKKGVY